MPVQRDKGQADLRGLKALVIGMGVLVILGTAVVIGVVVKRLYAPGNATGTVQAKVSTPEAALPAPAGLASLRLTVPKDAAIGGIAAVDGRLAVWVKDNEGGQVMLIDPRSNRLIGTVALAPR